MENFIDNLLESIFGGINSQMNIIVGVVLLIAGIALGISRKQSSKGKKIAGWICIGIGFLGVLSGIIQLVFP